MYDYGTIVAVVAGPLQNYVHSVLAITRASICFNMLMHVGAYSYCAWYYFKGPSLCPCTAQVKSMVKVLRSMESLFRGIRGAVYLHETKHMHARASALAY